MNYELKSSAPYHRESELWVAKPKKKISVLKVIRIIIAPFYFLFEMVGLVLIPIGVIGFMCGVMNIIYKALMGHKIDEKDWFITFCIVALPYFDTLKFIKGYD